MMKVFNETFGKARLGWIVPTEIAFDPESIKIRMNGEKLPPESVEYLVLYGIRQAANDRAAGAKSETETVKAVEAFLASLAEGKPVRSGAGGYRHYSEEDVETINVLASILRKKGMKAKEARDAAKEAVVSGTDTVEGVQVDKAREIAKANIAAMRDLLG